MFRKATKPTEGGVRVSTNVDLSRPHIKYPNLDGRGFGSIKFLSTPTPVDVSANGMAKKYSRGSIRTSYGSSGLLTGSRLNKKTLLGE
jgi:hypothetical protein